MLHGTFVSTLRSGQDTVHCSHIVHIFRCWGRTNSTIDDPDDSPSAHSPTVHGPTNAVVAVEPAKSGASGWMRCSTEARPRQTRLSFEPDNSFKCTGVSKLSVPSYRKLLKCSRRSI